MQNSEENKRRSSAAARTRATAKYHKTHYKRMYISTTPEQADCIRETAKQFDISIVQLIIDSVNEYKMNHGSRADTAQPEIVTTETPIESGKTAGTQPEEETEETTEEEAEDIPEELKAVRAAWARMGAFNEKITAERKRREAEERERRREITDEERYMMR